MFADPDAWPGLRMLDFDRAPTLAVAWVEMLSAFARDGVPGDAWGSWNGYDEETRSSMLIRKNGGSLQKDRDGEHRRAVWGETT